MVINTTVTAGTTYAANTIDIISLTGGKPAAYTQMTNSSGDEVNVKLNGRADAIFVLAASSTQIFNAGDLLLDKIQFDNSESGAVTSVVTTIIGY